MGDLSTHQSVTVVAGAVFAGLSKAGAALSAAAGFTATTVQNGASDVQATVQGVFDVDHAGYSFDFTAGGVEMGLDLAAEAVTRVVGSVRGTVDIPDFAYDAEIAIDGLGDSLQVRIDAVVTVIAYSIVLDEL